MGRAEDCEGGTGRAPAQEVRVWDSTWRGHCRGQVWTHTGCHLTRGGFGDAGAAALSRVQKYLSSAEMRSRSCSVTVQMWRKAGWSLVSVSGLDHKFCTLSFLLWQWRHNFGITEQLAASTLDLLKKKSWTASLKVGLDGLGCIFQP